MSDEPILKLKGSWVTVLAVAAIAAAVSSVTSLIVVYSVLRSQNPDQSSSPTSPASTVTVSAVAALGRLNPQGEVIHLSAPAFIEGARVDQLVVKLGDRVQSGQVVAILDSRSRFLAALERAKKQVIIAQARLDQVKAGAKAGAINAQEATIERLGAERRGQMAAQQATIERLEAELRNAKTECGRYQKLYQDGAISASDHDNKCLREETVLEQLNEAKVTLNRTEETLRKQLSEAKATRNQIAEVRPVDVAVIQAELADAKAAVQQAQANLDLAYVRSPKMGQILKIHTLPGEVISNKGIVELGQTDQMYAIAEVYEMDISKVRLGQQATITSKGVTGELRGIVDEIGLQIGKKDVLGTDPAADVDARVVEVKIRLDPADSKLVAALTNLQVNVVIDISSTQEKATKSLAVTSEASDK